MHERHGMRDSRLYNIWSKMRNRCNNPNNERYEDYGGRGITVCKEWNETFIYFWNWALANGYSDTLTLERKDNNLGYNPKNCKWATYKEQNKNRRPTLKKIR